MSKTDITKVALFCTASAPFSRQWIKEVRKQAVDSAICTTTGLPGDHFRLVPIPGNFRGYTPLQLARRYVVPVLGREESTFASQSFVVADDKTHEDGKLLVVAIDWDYFKRGPPLKIEGTLRIEPSMAIDTPVIFHSGIHHIDQYGGRELYDHDAEPTDPVETSSENRPARL